MRRTQEELKKEMIKYRVYQENNKWFGFKLCPECKKELKYEAQESYLLLRNIRNSEIKNTLCDVCCRTGERNPFFEKKHSENTKSQISKSRIGLACGENNAMANPEHRKSVSVAIKAKYDSGELDFLKKIQSDNAFKNQANGKLKNAPISAAEKEIKKLLEDYGYIVKSQFGIGSLKYDLFIKDKNLLIEYNGDYWHCNPNKYKSDYFHKKKQLLAKDIWKHDLIKKELAEKNGYKLFIIWEYDYMFNKEKEINKLISNI